MGPRYIQQCIRYSFALEGILQHLENHDVTYLEVARALIEEIEVVRKSGWRFTWISSYNTEFNYDFNVCSRPQHIAILIHQDWRISLAIACCSRTMQPSYFTPI